jgi:hypothetical protein
MPIYIIREFQNGSQLGETVNVDAENLQVAKKQTLLRASIFADEQHIENEVGVVLLKRINGVWKDPSFCPLPKPGRKPIKKASSDPVFVIRELRNNRQIQTVTIHAQNLRGAKHQAFRLAEQMDSVLTIETIDGVLLTRRENEGWQVPVDY